jgi:hypothetical protein
MEHSRRHSLLGIVAVAIFFINTALVLAALLILLATPPLSSSYARRFDMSLPFGICFVPAVYLVGLVLAIVGFRSGPQRRLFPVLGIILNGLALPAEIALNALWILLNV